MEANPSSKDASLCTIYLLNVNPDAALALQGGIRGVDEAGRQGGGREGGERVGKSLELSDASRISKRLIDRHFVVGGLAGPAIFWRDLDPTSISLSSPPVVAASGGSGWHMQLSVFIEWSNGMISEIR